MPDYTRDEIIDNAPIHLFGRADWDDCSSNVRALLFGQMVKRVAVVTREYQSDLYHDALTIHSTVNGPCEFLWIVRQSGTNFDDWAGAQLTNSPGLGAILYRVSLTEDKGSWSVTFTIVRKVIEMPYSETCIDMRIAGQRMLAEPLSNGMVQLYTTDDTPFSAPITIGEAGMS